MKKASAPQVLLIITAFLAPLIGGQLNTEAGILEPGLGSLLRSIFSGFDSILAYYVKGYDETYSLAINTPTLSHAILGLLVVAATILVVAKRQVFQVPFQRVSIPLIAFMVWIVCTVAFSSFTTVSLVALAEWLIYGIAFFVVVAAAGRRQGSQWILNAIILGCTLVAFKGLAEYGSAASAGNPSWRVFSTWQNPTSLAGILAMGAMIALGSAIRKQNASAVVPWTAALAMCCCIMVTDARGGILCMLAGMLCLAGFTVSWLSRKQALEGLAKICSVLILALVFGRMSHKAGDTHAAVTQTKSPYVLVGQQSPTPPTQPAPRAVPQQSGDTEQSSGFRMLLYKGAVETMKGNPLGYGIGTYRFNSARSGLNTETHLTHNTYLQIGVETGILGFILLLGFLGLWLLEVVRGCYQKLVAMSFLRVAAAITISFVALSLLEVVSYVAVFPSTKQKIAGAFGMGLIWLYVEFFRRVPNLASNQNILRASVIAAAISFLSHSVFESGFYSFGIGLTGFIILGIGLVQSADGVAPEYIPTLLRGASGVVAFVAGVLLLHAGVTETLRARSRYEFAISQDATLPMQTRYEALREANTQVDKALSLIAPLDEMDGENWRQKAIVADQGLTRMVALRRAALYAPNVRNLRQLAISQTETGEDEAAIGNLEKALAIDPHNLLTLPRLRDAYLAAGQNEKAIDAARRTIDVEKTPYFQVRSLQELVPVETYEARAFLAQQTQDLQERAQLLEAAAAGYERFRTITVPMIVQLARVEPLGRYGGESLETATYKMKFAEGVASQLADTYKQLGKPEDEARAKQMKLAFANSVPTREQLMRPVQGA